MVTLLHECISRFSNCTNGAKLQSNTNEFKLNSHQHKIWRCDMAHKLLTSFAYTVFIKEMLDVKSEKQKV